MSFIRVSLRGTLPGNETWSVNPAYNETTDTVSWDQAKGQAAADAIAVVAIPAALQQLRSSAALLSSVRVERRTDSNVLLGAAEATWPQQATGLGSPAHPPQTSTVLSLRTITPGSRGRGRLYWPAIGAALATATLRLNSPTASATASAASAYLDLIETALKNALNPTPSLIDYHLCVYSPTTSSKTDVNRIQVGDVLDVQRRRRDRLVEAYSTVAYP